MDFSDPTAVRAFFAVHRDLPREGPGDDASTLAALELAGPLPANARVLDIACGPGMQTLALAAALPGARLVAVDVHEPFLEQLRASAAASGLADRIDARVADMGDLPFDDGSFDLLWCEGAAYFLGIERALDSWRRLLAPGGIVAFTEAVWLTEAPSSRARACWLEYPAMADVAANRAIIERCGYELLGDFVLPASSWWTHYYGPMQARLDGLGAGSSDPVSAEVLRECREEIAVWQAHGDEYSYAFFVCRVPG